MDDLTVGQAIVQPLREIGFSRISEKSFDASRYPTMGGIYIDWGSASDYPNIQELVIECLLSSILLSELPSNDHLG